MVLSIFGVGCVHTLVYNWFGLHRAHINRQVVAVINYIVINWIGDYTASFCSFFVATMVSKIAIFGGTGMTGKCVTEYALEKGNDAENKPILN